MTETPAQKLQKLMALSEEIGYHGDDAATYASLSLALRRQLAGELLTLLEGPHVTFVTRLRQGTAHPDDFLGEVRRWLDERAQVQTVTEFLGLTQEEYDTVLGGDLSLLAAHHRAEAP